eukprot:jgi/Botrbrau1/23438/Bobra.0455s0001.1
MYYIMKLRAAPKLRPLQGRSIYMVFNKYQKGRRNFSRSGGPRVIPVDTVRAEARKLIMALSSTHHKHF